MFGGKPGELCIEMQGTFFLFLLSSHERFIKVAIVYKLKKLTLKVLNSEN